MVVWLVGGKIQAVIEVNAVIKARVVKTVKSDDGKGSGVSG